MKYMFLLYGDESIGETPTRISEERSAQWGEFHQLAESSGKLISWHALVPSDEAKTVKPGTGTTFSSTDGPYAETKEQLGGVYILDCADMAEAMSYAEKMPCAAHGVVEVRQMV